MRKFRTHYKLIDKHNTGYISHEGFRQMTEKLKEFARMLLPFKPFQMFWSLKKK
jgi:Ca2+-binding EF-hand superfamily protein